MEISIYCSECGKKTNHSIHNINTDIYDDKPNKWMCNECKTSYYEGILIFEGKEQKHQITKDRNTKQFLLNRLKK